MTRRSLRPSCGLIAWWMSALSRLPVLLLVFVHPVCTSESRRATDRWFTFRAERLHVSARFSAQMRLDCTEASPDTAPAPPIVLRFPHLSCKLKARTKVEDTAVACVHVSASVCVCVCVCVWLCIARGWRPREEEEEEGGGVVGNRSILQMLRGRRSEWKVLWLSVARRSLTRGGMPHAASSRLSLTFSLTGRSPRSSGEVSDGEVRWKDQGEGRGRKGEEEKIEKHVYSWRLGLTS